MPETGTHANDIQDLFRNVPTPHLPKRGQPCPAWPASARMIAGFDSHGRAVHDGINGKERTDTADRDPFTGIPHRRYVRCRVQKFEETAAR